MLNNFVAYYFNGIVFSVVILKVSVIFHTFYFFVHLWLVVCFAVNSFFRLELAFFWSGYLNENLQCWMIFLNVKSQTRQGARAETVQTHRFWHSPHLPSHNILKLFGAIIPFSGTLFHSFGISFQFPKGFPTETPIVQTRQSKVAWSFEDVK